MGNTECQCPLEEESAGLKSSHCSFFMFDFSDIPAAEKVLRTIVKPNIVHFSLESIFQFYWKTVINVPGQKVKNVVSN